MSSTLQGQQFIPTIQQNPTLQTKTTETGRRQANNTAQNKKPQLNSADKSMQGSRIGKKPSGMKVDVSVLETGVEPLSGDFWKENGTPQVKFSTQKTAHEEELDSPV